MPNLEILRKFDRTVILDAIRSSNRMKIEREARPAPAVALQLPLERLEMNQLAGAKVSAEG
jgi:hypothetical protein